MSEPGLPEAPVTYDLARLSDFNFRRHRLLRYASAATGVALAVAIVLFTWESVSEALPEFLGWGRLAFMAASVAVGYFCIAIAWIPVRLLARPPVSISLTSQGIELEVRHGKAFRFDWTDSRLTAELLFRDSDPTIASESRYRLLIGRGAYDLRAPWRRLPPIAYLTEVCANGILKLAEDANLRIEKVDSPHSLSLVRSELMTAYLLSK